MIGGGILGDQTKGEAVVAGMNLMGYNAMALGLKELSLGQQVLRQRMKEAQFPVLSANVLGEGVDGPFAPAYTLLNVGGHRIAVVGITRLPSKPVAGFQVLEPKDALAQILPEISSKADTIILLTNLDYRSARALVEAVPGIDLAIAAQPDQLPQQVLTAQGTGTLIVTADQPLERHTGRRVGQLIVTVQPDGSLASPSWQSLPMTSAYADDPGMKALLDGYRK